MEMKITDEKNLIKDFADQNKDLETNEGVPVDVFVNTVLTNAGRTLLSMQTGQTGLFALRSDSTGIAFIIKTTRNKKGDKPSLELIAVLPLFKGGKAKSSGVKALERQLDFYVRDRLKAESQRVNAAKKSHEVIEFDELKFTYWEGIFYDSNMTDMLVIK